MPSVRINLEVDPSTRKRTVTIAYESDLDALPHEHEEAHRALVNKLFEGGILKEGDDIKVEREGETAKGEEAAAEAPAQREAVKGST